MAAKKKTTKKKTAKKKPILKNRPNLKLNQKTIDEMVAIVERGNLRSTACKRLKIPISTYDDWIKAGKRQIREVQAGERPAPLLQGQLVIALEEAEGKVQGRMIEDILEKGSIKARIWYLKTRFPKEFSGWARTQREDESGREYEVDARALLAERLGQFLEDK